MLRPHALLDILTQRVRQAPRDGGLERLPQQKVVHDPVTQVGDPEGKLVAAFAVLRSSLEASIVRGEWVDALLLRFDLAMAPFKDQRAGRHALGVEAFDLRHEPLLKGALDLAQSRAAALEHLAELELEIVDQADAGGRCALLSELVDKAHAFLEVREDDRAVDLSFGQRKDLDDGLCHDAEGALGAIDPAACVADAD